MSSCFGLGKSRSEEEREPLLPRYRDDTELQRELHQKLHSYQMIRALSKGYMPSNEQLIVNLRTLLGADILNPSNPDLSDSGRLLIKYTKQFLQQFIELLQNKNGNDQIQDFIWFLSKSRISVDVEDITSKAYKAKSRADTAAAYSSLRTVGSLLVTNSDFRVFLGDLNIIAREVFKDTAFTLSSVAEEAGKKLEPAPEDKQAVQNVGADDGSPPSGQDLGSDVAEVSKVIGSGTVEVAKTAQNSIAEKVSGAEGQVLLNRLKEAVLNLRKRNDYSDSVSTLSKLVKRYAMLYSRAVKETVETLDNDIEQNPETDRALKNFWSFITSFGDPEEWRATEDAFKQIMSHRENDPEFEDLMNDVANSLQKLLTDPDFFDHANEKFQELRAKSKKVGTESSLREDIDNFLGHLQLTLKSVWEDRDISRLFKTSTQIFRILNPVHAAANSELIQDSINIFVPLLIQAIQYIPIPRIEISNPDIDLLLENLIIEPGKTVNNTSFLPYKLRIETYNDLEIRKAKFRTTTTSSHLVTIKIDGISVRAEEVGFWMRAHAGIFRLADEGIASFA
ncbi:hypothetical protein LTR66_014348, partial [Elasticomyces elasticus]